MYATRIPHTQPTFPSCNLRILDGRHHNGALSTPTSSHCSARDLQGLRASIFGSTAFQLPTFDPIWKVQPKPVRTITCLCLPTCKCVNRAICRTCLKFVDVCQSRSSRASSSPLDSTLRVVRKSRLTTRLTRLALPGVYERLCYYDPFSQLTSLGYG